MSLNGIHIKDHQVPKYQSMRATGVTLSTIGIIFINNLQVNLHMALIVDDSYGVITYH